MTERARAPLTIHSRWASNAAWSRYCSRVFVRDFEGDYLRCQNISQRGVVSIHPWALQWILVGNPMRSLIDGADDNATLTKDSDDSHHSSIFHCFSFWIEWVGRDIVSAGSMSDGQEQDTDAPASWMWPWYTTSRHVNTRRSCKCGSSHKGHLVSADMMSGYNSLHLL